MDDARIWEFESSLWKADADGYREAIDDNCLMVVPSVPYLLEGSEVLDAVTNTPRWTAVEISNQRVSRPQDGLIVVAYRVEASRDDADSYTAFCTSTYRRIEHEVWRVVQHQQTPPPVVEAAAT